MIRPLSALFAAFLVPAGAAEKPNFIFILSDDVAQGDLGCYGQKVIQTPRLDAMAAQGTRFTQMYCGTTVCAPSRSSFFTGLHTGHSPVRGNYELPKGGQLPLPDETVTIAEVAKSAGYATATIGKWGMGFFGSTGEPARQGVDHFFGYNCQRHAHSYFPTHLFKNDESFPLPGNDGRSVGKTYAQDLIQRDAIGWLKENAKKPFFLFYAITLPHGRHEIDDFGIYADKPWTNEQKSYAAQVTRLDRDVGEVLDTLKELGIDKNTLVVFTGDNGSSFGPESGIGKLFDQTANGLRGFKRSMYEGALRQAGIAWWPGTVPAGRVRDEPWAFWDMMPTFAALSGATPPKGYETDGLCLVDFLKGGAAPKREYFYWELHEGKSAARAARWDDWKAVLPAFGKPIELYDLAKDPGEKTNLADDKPELVKRAEAIFADAHRPHPEWPLDRKSENRVRLSEEAWKIRESQKDEAKGPKERK
jgi:arylsulfatase A-like enzyme